MDKPLQIFCCYAREDQDYLYRLKKHLMVLQREGLIEVKADINIRPGAEWERETSRYLEQADIILLLISADFMDSDYCYQHEMQRAMERQKQGTACVVPVIIHPTDWQATFLGQMQALPRNAKPVSTWKNPEEAFLSIAEGIRTFVQDFSTTTTHDNEEERRPADDSAWERKAVSNPNSAGDFTFNGSIGHQTIIAGGSQGQVIGEQYNYYAPPRDGIRALEKGSEALWNGDYPAAKRQLRIAVDEIARDDRSREASRAHCFLALALLDGRLPRVHVREVMQSVETLMNTAIEICPSQSYWRILACIKKDFLTYNGFKHRLKEVYAVEHKGAAFPRHVEDEKNEQYFRRSQPRLQL